MDDLHFYAFLPGIYQALKLMAIADIISFEQRPFSFEEE